MLSCYVKNQSPPGHEKESQMTYDEPFGFFVVLTVGILFLATRHKINYMAERTARRHGATVAILAEPRNACAAGFIEKSMPQS